MRKDRSVQDLVVLVAYFRESTDAEELAGVQEFASPISFQVLAILVLDIE